MITFGQACIAIKDLILYQSDSEISSVTFCLLI